MRCVCVCGVSVKCFTKIVVLHIAISTENQQFSAYSIFSWCISTFVCRCHTSDMPWPRRLEPCNGRIVLEPDEPDDGMRFFGNKLIKFDQPLKSMHGIFEDKSVCPGCGFNKWVYKPYDAPAEQYLVGGAFACRKGKCAKPKQDSWVFTFLPLHEREQSKVLQTVPPAPLMLELDSTDATLALMMQLGAMT